MNYTNTEILKEKWDILIILDACRYDYFEKIWRRFLSDGQLFCKCSIGSCTDEWRDNSFPGFYEDIVYITANPQISASSRVYGFMASEHFKYIHEIWRENWDDKSGTVLPEIVSQRAKEIISQYPQGMRYIIHYLQPHAPYLNVSYSKTSLSLHEFNQFLINPESDNSPTTMRLKIFRAMLPLFRSNRILTNHPEWWLRKLLGIPPRGPMEIAWRVLGLKGLRDAYKTNLEVVLASVASLIEQLSGTVVISSDHGELLGEDRQYAHPRGSRHPLLRDVPWLVITKDKDTDFQEIAKAKCAVSSSKQMEDLHEKDKKIRDQTVIERLRALGYY